MFLKKVKESVGVNLPILKGIRPREAKVKLLALPVLLTERGKAKAKVLSLVPVVTVKLEIARLSALVLNREADLPNAVNCKRMDVIVLVVPELTLEGLLLLVRRIVCLAYSFYRVSAIKVQTANFCTTAMYLTTRTALYQHTGRYCAALVTN